LQQNSKTSNVSHVISAISNNFWYPSPGNGSAAATALKLLFDNLFDSTIRSGAKRITVIVVDQIPNDIEEYVRQQQVVLSILFLGLRKLFDDTSNNQLIIFLSLLSED
jgi:hypothetical protein